MRILIPLLILSGVGLTACGKETNSANGEAPVTDASPADPGIEECMIADLNEAVDPACRSVIYNGGKISGVTVTETQVEARASRRSGGTGGTKWFDSRKTFASPMDLVLPTQIPAVGNAANGHKLYIKFNDQTDCAWFSHAGTKYQTPRCFDGATRAPGTSLGFTGGVEVDHVRVDGVTQITMTVNGSGGGGTLTTATAAFAID